MRSGAPAAHEVSIELCFWGGDKVVTSRAFTHIRCIIRFLVMCRDAIVASPHVDVVIRRLAIERGALREM